MAVPATVLFSGILMLAKLGVNTAQRVQSVRDAQRAADEAILEARRQAAELSQLFAMRSMARAEEMAQVVGAQSAMLAMQGVAGGTSGIAAAASAARTTATEVEADAIQTRQRMRELNASVANAKRMVDEMRERAVFGTINELLSMGGTAIDLGVAAKERALQEKLVKNPNLLGEG